MKTPNINTERKEEILPSNDRGRENNEGKRKAVCRGD